MESDQSRSSKSCRSRSAYAVMRSIHCFMGMRTTGWSPRSLLPSMTYMPQEKEEAQARGVQPRRLLVWVALLPLVINDLRSAGAWRITGT
eukprot:1159421-Pelagomonas_calceolata.AAC.6